MLSEQLKAKIKERSVVKNRLYLVPMNEEDTDEILSPESEFLKGAPRKVLNDKFLSVIAFNISNKDIVNDHGIQTELINRGIVSWEPLQKTKPELRSVKLHFNDREKTSLFLKNFYVDNFKILTESYESLEIRIEPDIPSPRQCYKCFAIGHVKEQCKPETQQRCGHCMNTEHSTEDCDKQKVNHKCSICDHSSLDRRCKAYRSAKREAANLAFETITKSKTNAKKKYLKDENFNAAQQTHPQTHSYSEALIHNNETTNIANKNELFGLCKDINCIINENTKNQKQTEDNKKNFAEGMERLGLAIESTNKIAVKFDETLKSLTTTMAQISRHECDIVRNEFEINLSQVKKEYTEFYNSNSNRIERIENQLRAITHPNTYQPQTTLPFQK